VSPPEIIYVDSGKHEFKEQAKKDTPDYSKAFRILTNQIKKDPKNAELRYFLGYTIDRLNSNDGKGMIGSSKDLTIKASEQFEEVNRLQPKYEGEILILDPYSKISSVWGSLAASYLYQKKTDSAKWAFSEGKKRGGFIEPILQFNRQLLNSCEKNSILVTYGDNLIIPIWYLQLMENLRTDITIVDGSLINTIWYPKYLKNEMQLRMSLSDKAIDTIEYIEWKTQNVSVVNPNDKSQSFTWELRPSYADQYILKGDRILLDIIQQNFYQRPIYFGSNSDSSYNLFLTSYLANEGIVDRLTTKISVPQQDWSAFSKNAAQYNIERIKAEDIQKSPDAILTLNGFRWTYFFAIHHLIETGDNKKAKELINLMYKKFEKEKLPFTSDKVEKYFKDVFRLAEKKYM